MNPAEPRPSSRRPPYLALMAASTLMAIANVVYRHGGCLRGQPTPSAVTPEDSTPEQQTPTRFALRTEREIEQLVELAATALDADGDGEVSALELSHRRAPIEGVLRGFGIDTSNDLQFWTREYQPGTDVERDDEGHLVHSATPHSSRAHSKAAYEDGRLLQEALRIDGASDEDLQRLDVKIATWEQAWLEYHESTVARMRRQEEEGESHLKHVFCFQLADEKWGLSCSEAFDGLSVDAQWDVYDGVLLNVFSRNQHLRWADELRSDMVHFLSTGDGNCSTLAVLGLHLLRLTDSHVYRPMFLPSHVSLALETPNGPIFLNVGGRFMPPGHYESAPSEEVTRRHRQQPLEPWQVLAGVYFNRSGRLLRRRAWADARTAAEAGLALYPDSATGLHLHGETLRALGDPEGAIRRFREALTISPGYPPSQALLEELAAEQAG